MAGQLVIGGGELVPELAELGAAHRLLKVLDAHADSEALALQGQAGLIYHLKGVPGGMAGGQHQRVAGEAVGAGPGHDGDAGQPSAALAQRPELVPEADIRPQGQQLLPDGFHHAAKDVGADVGLVGPLDVLRRAVGHENAEHVGDAGVVHPGGQLAVGKRPRAPLAELDVGGGGEQPGLPKTLHVPGAPVHVLSPLQHNGAQARPGQGEGGEQPRRAHAYHHRGQGGGAAQGGRRIGRLRHRLHAPGSPPEDGPFII